MKVSDIPYAKLTGIEQNDTKLSLQKREDILNHINTIHASAQFTLAETQSGMYLQEIFPELKEKAVPLLREAQIKYSKPAIKKIVAYANTSAENIIKFKEKKEKKGRGSIVINIEIKDINDVLTCKATFNWFIQRL